MDLTETITPRSDQMNAEDLLTGPRTFTVEKVSKGSTEQPVDIHLVEFPGRPFRPSKTVRRILVAAWGPEASNYVGRRMTLYRDPAVKFGGMDVGGIRVSHLSHIDRPLSLALTVTRGKRAPYTVQPLVEDPGAGRAEGEAAKPAPASRTGNRDSNDPAQSQERLWAKLQATLTDWQRATESSRDDVKAFVASVIGRDIASTTELTVNEAHAVIDDALAGIGGAS